MSTGAERPSHQLLRHPGSRNQLFSSNPVKKPARGSLTSAAPMGEKRGEKQEESFTNAGKKAPKAAGRAFLDAPQSASYWISHRGFAKMLP